MWSASISFDDWRQAAVDNPIAHRYEALIECNGVYLRKLDDAVAEIGGRVQDVVCSVVLNVY